MIEGAVGPAPTRTSDRDPRPEGASTPRMVSPRSPQAAVTTLQSALGNRATTRILARNGPGGGGGGAGGGRRVVEVDGQVFSEINRGNTKMADAMKDLKRSGARIVVGEGVQTEMFGEKQSALKRSAYRAMADDFGVEIAPADLRTTSAARLRFAEELSKFSSGFDAAVAAEAAAAGAEYWSTEKTFRKNRTALAKISGFRLAPESDIENVGASWDYAVGRALLGLEPITIAADGTVTRAPSGGGGSSGSGGGGGGGGAGGHGGGSYSGGQRATAAVALAALGVNIALNSWIAHRNKKAIQDALEKLEPDMKKAQQQFPTLGFMLHFRYSGAVDSGEGPTATGRFEGVGWTTAATKDQAMANWSVADERSITYEHVWIDPIDFSAAKPPSWDVVAEAELAESDHIEFLRLGFRQHALVGSRGFYAKGRYSAGSSKASSIRENFRLLVLNPPSSLPYYDTGHGLSHEDVHVQDVYALGGLVPALDLGDVQAIPVVPANTMTRGFFDKVKAHIEIDDKADALSPISYLEHVGWLDRDQIRIVRYIDTSWQAKTAARDRENMKALERQREQQRLREQEEGARRQLEEEDERRRQQEPAGAGAGSRSG